MIPLNHKNMRSIISIFIILFCFTELKSQDYFLENNGPYDNKIQTPEQFLGYEIGFEHTRHDLILAYLNYLSNASEKAEIIKYGDTHEGRDLIMLTVSSANNLKNIDKIREEHLGYTIPKVNPIINKDLPIIINLGYGVP